jgi:hypothetical protein
LLGKKYAEYVNGYNFLGRFIIEADVWMDGEFISGPRSREAITFGADFIDVGDLEEADRPLAVIVPNLSVCEDNLGVMVEGSGTIDMELIVGDFVVSIVGAIESGNFIGEIDGVKIGGVPLTLMLANIEENRAVNGVIVRHATGYDGSTLYIGLGYLVDVEALDVTSQEAIDGALERIQAQKRSKADLKRKRERARSNRKWKVGYPKDPKF